MSEILINIAQNFSRFPGGRHRTDGRFSGEEFREDFLLPALRQHDRVIVNLDGVAGLPSSFLEEAFGGLVRRGLNAKELASRLLFTATTPRMQPYPAMIRRYIEHGAPAREMAGG